MCPCGPYGHAPRQANPVLTQGHRGAQGRVSPPYNPLPPQTLSVRVNKLEFVEPIVNCASLSELYLGKNFLNLISFVNTLPGLIVLDCSDNKVIED